MCDVPGFEALPNHTPLREFVAEYAGLCKPKAIRVVNGSEEEASELCETLVEAGVFTQLNPEIRANSFLARSDPRDVARSEERTIIACAEEKDAGPTNHWREPGEMKSMMGELYAGSMEGRVMFVVPFSMGPIGGPGSHIGIELTDSEYVVVNMGIMTQMGDPVLEELGQTGDFVKCVHSVGFPLPEGKQDIAWPCDPDNKWIAHYPQNNLVESYGSGYGGNALLGKKCFALRLASVMARDNGWLAEHMLIQGLTDPDGNTTYVAAAFPSACGKTNLAMLEPTIPGWKVSLVGDDIAWMRFGDDGRLYAINPEAGFFGVAPGTSMDSNPNAVRSLTKNCIFTNVALTPEGDVWWEGINGDAGPHTPPEGTIDWRGNVFDPDAGTPAAHPNARFTAPIANCPVLDPAAANPGGVPVSALIFGGRRPNTIPLVHEALDWTHGVLLSASTASQKTAAADGSDVGVVRHDPAAMLPFFGYNAGQYYAHWLSLQDRTGVVLPKIFMVNWFRKDPETRTFLWPGFGENSRVLKWIVQRSTGQTVASVETPIGILPTVEGLDLEGLELDPEHLAQLLTVDAAEWVNEYGSNLDYFDTVFGDDFPAGLRQRLCDLLSAATAASEASQ